MSPRNSTKTTAAPAVGTRKKAVPTDEYTVFLVIAVVALLAGLTLLFMENSRLTEQLGSDPIASAPRA